MTRLKSMDIGMIKLQLSQFLIPYVLGSYKFGLFFPEHTEFFLTRKFNGGVQPPIKTCPFIEYKIVSGLMGSTPIMTLTRKGHDFIKNNFVNLMIENPLFYTAFGVYPGDTLDVVKDITKNRASGLKGLHVSILEKGTYVIKQIDRNSVIVADDMNLLYRIKLYETKTLTRFSANQLETNEIELKKRFPKINLRGLILKASKLINNLTLTEVLNGLYEDKLFDDRLEKN